ncbi:hypothetical protein AoKodu_23120 [Actinomyces oris K20]|nr:hypothetical protein AoKodu_23120 [Actinomyces oris K20]
MSHSQALTATMPTAAAALHASCQPMTAPVSPHAASSTRLPHPIGVTVCISQRSGRSAAAASAVSRDCEGLALRASLAEVDDAADDADCADAGVPEDVGAAAEEVDAPDRPAEPGRAWRAGFFDVV